MASLLTIIVLFVVFYLLSKHTKLKTLITRLAVHQLQNKSKVIDALSPEKKSGLIKTLFVHAN